MRRGAPHLVEEAAAAHFGTRLTGRMAADLAREEGVAVEAVLISDDVAVEDSLYTAGRRGVGVTVLAEKMAGAAADPICSMKLSSELAVLRTSGSVTS